MSDDWNLYVGGEYKALFKAKTDKEMKAIISRIEEKLPLWLESRKDIIKEGDDWHEADKDEELRQSSEGTKITEHEAVTLLIAEVISKAIADLRRKKDKQIFIQVKDKNRKIRDIKLMDKNQLDAYRFLFEKGNLERFLAYWSYDLDANFLRRKILETYNLSHMQESQELPNLSITSLESIGKK